MVKACVLSGIWVAVFPNTAVAAQDDGADKVPPNVGEIIQLELLPLMAAMLFMLVFVFKRLNPQRTVEPPILLVAVLVSPLLGEAVFGYVGNANYGFNGVWSRPVILAVGGDYGLTPLVRDLAGGSLSLLAYFPFLVVAAVWGVLLLSPRGQKAKAPVTAINFGIVGALFAAQYLYAWMLL